MNTCTQLYSYGYHMGQPILTFDGLLAILRTIDPDKYLHGDCLFSIKGLNEALICLYVGCL